MLRPKFSIGLVAVLNAAGACSADPATDAESSSVVPGGSMTLQPMGSSSASVSAPGPTTTVAAPSTGTTTTGNGSGSSTVPTSPPDTPTASQPGTQNPAMSASDEPDPGPSSSAVGSGGTGGVMDGPTPGGGATGGDLPTGGTGGTGAGAAGGVGDPGSAGAMDPGGEPGGTTEPCPADATFCSGFDSSELPEGAVFKLNGDPATPWTALFAVDTEVKSRGASSLRVRKNSEPNASTMYKMLSVPSGGADFWVRLYIRSDVELGQEGHNAYAIASVNDEPNDASKVEFADDVGLSFNASDTVRWPEGYGRLESGGTNPYSLPANEWHCVELHFDGAGRTQSLYVASEELIAASDYPGTAISFGAFKFGYLGYHNEADRTVWYDDVAVGPTRIGCLE